MVNRHSIKKLIPIVLLIGLFFGAKANAQTQELELIEDLELTLEEAIQVAVANSPQVKRALLSVDDADQLVKIAYGEVFPEVTSSIGYTRNVEIPVTYIPAQLFDPTAAPGVLAPVKFGTDNNWQGGFTVNQTLFKGETIIALSSAAVFKKVQEENFRATSQQVITQTRISYYQVLAVIEQLRLQQSQIQRLEQNLSENKARQRAGLIDAYDVLRIEVQLSNQKPQLIEAEYAVEEAYRNLKVVMGLPLRLNFNVKGSLNQFDILTNQAVSDENEAIKRIDQLNPFTFEKMNADESVFSSRRGDLRLLDASIDLSNKEFIATKSRFLPTLSATYNLQWNSAEPDSPTFFENANRFQTLGLNLSLPIFQGFKRVADVERVLIQRKDLEEQRRATLLQAENEVTSASEDLNMAFEIANARKIALRQAKEGYQRSLKRLENGLGSQIEVTEAEVQVRQAEVNYALMVFNYLTAKAQYDLATGTVPFVDTDYTESN